MRQLSRGYEYGIDKKSRRKTKNNGKPHTECAALGRHTKVWYEKSQGPQDKDDTKTRPASLVRCYDGYDYA